MLPSIQPTLWKLPKFFNISIKENFRNRPNNLFHGILKVYKQNRFSRITIIKCEHKLMRQSTGRLPFSEIRPI
jgi:hypothetical protein